MSRRRHQPTVVACLVRDRSHGLGQGDIAGQVFPGEVACVLRQSVVGQLLDPHAREGPRAGRSAWGIIDHRHFVLEHHGIQVLGGVRI